MHILVTGGAGYVGSHACKSLAEAGHTPVVLDNLSNGHADAVLWGPLVEGDIANEELVRATIREHKIEGVMHFAALAEVGESVREPDRYWRNNVGGTLALLSAARAEGVQRFVFSSTCAIFGPVDQPISEYLPANPLSPYGHTKLAAEMLLRDHAAAFDIGAVALRYFNAAGADPESRIGERHDPESHLIPIALEVAAGEREYLAIFGTDYDTPDGTCIRDYIHVDDLSQAHVLAIEAATPGRFDAFNLGTGIGHSVREVADVAARVTGRKLTIREEARRPGDPPRLVADPSKARKVLGWQAQHTDLETIVRHAWAFKQSQLARAG